LDEMMENPDMMDLFLSNGADVNATQSRTLGGMRNAGRQQSSLLSRVVAKGNVPMVKLLLERRANVNVADTLVNRNERGYNSDSFDTPLHHAAGQGHLHMTKLLLEHRAEVDAVRRELVQESLNKNSPTDDPRSGKFQCNVRCRPSLQTSLHLALKSGHSEVATLLVCWGANTGLCSVLRRSEEQNETDIEVWLDGDEIHSCEQLASGSDALQASLSARYCAETHHLFPADAKRVVCMVRLVAKRQQWPLGESALLRVLFFAVPELSLPLDAAADDVAEAD